MLEKRWSARSRLEGCFGFGYCAGSQEDLDFVGPIVAGVSGLDQAYLGHLADSLWGRKVRQMS